MVSHRRPQPASAPHLPPGPLPPLRLLAQDDGTCLTYTSHNSEGGCVEWSEERADTYIAGCANDCETFSTLSAAKTACENEAWDTGAKGRCGGVVKQGFCANGGNGASFDGASAPGFCVGDGSDGGAAEYHGGFCDGTEGVEYHELTTLSSYTEQQCYDEIQTTGSCTNKNIFSFGRGTRAGTCLCDGVADCSAGLAQPASCASNHCYDRVTAANQGAETYELRAVSASYLSTVTVASTTDESSWVRCTSFLETFTETVTGAWYVCIDPPAAPPPPPPPTVPPWPPTAPCAYDEHGDYSCEQGTGYDIFSYGGAVLDACPTGFGTRIGDSCYSEARLTVDYADPTGQTAGNCQKVYDTL